ncbi:unnamed protein product [Caenorhabditis auriculariae]|uniref:Uncharacterized protein n=1 Tax=Caenorhabditis auriculariae TaxID=2777116 RepID=A0A8S1HJB2_9PELO|nr:unnamed protein product [Caenorhabditis auriculariae]
MARALKMTVAVRLTSRPSHSPVSDLGRMDSALPEWRTVRSSLEHFGAQLGPAPCNIGDFLVPHGCIGVKTVLFVCCPSTATKNHRYCTVQAQVTHRSAQG